jgi:hypothetical protein
MYLELLHGTETYFEMCRSSLVDVSFEKQEGSSRDAEICVLWFLFVKSIRGQLNNLNFK